MGKTEGWVDHFDYITNPKFTISRSQNITLKKKNQNGFFK